MDLASVVAALASVGVRVSGSAPNSSVQVDSSRACPPGLAGPEPSGTIYDLGQHFQTDWLNKKNRYIDQGWFFDGCIIKRLVDSCRVICRRQSMLVQAGCWCQFSATKKTSQSTLTFAVYVIV